MIWRAAAIYLPRQADTLGTAKRARLDPYEKQTTPL